MSDHLNDIQNIVNRFPEGPERDWWNKYLWYRKYEVIFWRIAIIGSPILLLNVISAFLPKSLELSILSLCLSSSLMFVVLAISIRFMWNRHFKETSEVDKRHYDD